MVKIEIFKKKQTGTTLERVSKVNSKTGFEATRDNWPFKKPLSDSQKRKAYLKSLCVLPERRAKVGTGWPPVAGSSRVWEQPQRRALPCGSIRCIFEGGGTERKVSPDAVNTQPGA